MYSSLFSCLLLLAIAIPSSLFSSDDSTLQKSKHKKKKNHLAKIILDAGHGGKDPGAIGTNGAREKDVTLAIVLALGKLIAEELPDVSVGYTRKTDKFVELYKRGDVANKLKGNLFISIHCNSTPEKPAKANGMATYFLRPGKTDAAIRVAAKENAVIEYEKDKNRYQALSDIDFILTSMRSSSDIKFSEKFAALVQKELKESVGIKNNGVEQAGFYVLVGAAMPSVLIETAFISNPKEEALLASEDGQEKFARGILEAIKSFKKHYEGS